MQAGRWSRRIAAMALLLATTLPVRAQNYFYDIDNSGIDGTPIEQPHPLFPGNIRTGQEGWVRLNFVISPDGHALYPIILDSVGGAGFEESARSALSNWLFEPPGAMLANNTVDIRFEIYRGRDRATSNFLRRYRQIMMHITNGETEQARSQVDKTTELGGWNLYESAMLSLMQGRVAGAEAKVADKLEYYRRALAFSNDNALRGEDLRELLVKLVGLQLEHQQYAAARQTVTLLRGQIGSSEDIAALAKDIADLDTRLASSEPLRASATLYNPCDCASGQPLWEYRPARRTFSFGALSGNVERFEVRCKHDRLQGTVDVSSSWTLPEAASSCRVFVFGDDGASFEFVEYQDE